MSIQGGDIVALVSAGVLEQIGTPFVSDILDRVNDITGRKETNIDKFLIEALIEISRRTCELKYEATGNTTADQNYIGKPTDLVMLDYVVIDDERYDKITFAEFLNQEKDGCVERGTKIYIRPTPIAAYDYTVYYRRLHPSNTTILFRADFFPCIYHLVAAKVYEKYEISDKEAEQRVKYEGQIKMLMNTKADDEDVFVCTPGKKGVIPR